MSNYSRMADLNMDELFPGLLSQEEMQIVHEHKKARAAKLKKERDINTPSKLLEVDPAEFIIKGGGIDENGNVVDDFDMRAYMDAMEDKDTGLLHDLKIDLRDVPLAKNFYDYCFRMSGKKIHPPWSRQLWIGAMLFGEVCVKETCTDPDWLNIYNVPKDFPAKDMPERMTFLEHGKCPHCGATKLELIQKHGLGNYIQLVNVLGQRSGKSSSMATYAGYHLHRILKFQNYASLSKTMQASTEITGTMVSLTFAKAKSVMWTPFKQIVQQDHDWFKMLFDVLDDYKLRYGKELYTLGADSMHFKWKNIRYYPSGPKSSTLRGDCLTGDTMVNTNAGFVRLDELKYDDGFRMARNMLIDSPEGPLEVSHTYKKVDREIYKISTRNGIVIKGTPEHPVLVLTPDLNYKWVRLDSIKVGDHIVSTTAHNSPMFGKSDITLDQATVMGTFLANGYRTEISSDDSAVITRFKNAIEGCGYSVSTRVTEDPTIRASTHNVVGRGFTKALSDWGYASVKAAEKRIPTTIRMAPKEVLHEFLESYFACDCGINRGATSRAKAAGASSGVEIEVSSASRRLVRELQIILLQVYGIVGRIGKHVELKNMSTREYKEKQYVTWILTITGYDSWLFAKTFKRAKIQKYADRIERIPAGFGSDRRYVPHIRGFLSDFWASLNGKFGQQYFTTPQGKKIRRPTKPACLTGRTKDRGAPEFLVYEDAGLEDMADFMSEFDPLKAQRLNKFLDYRSHYEEVVSVTAKTKKTTVYDVTVPEGHCFTANGLASHNTRIFAALDELGLFRLPTGDDEEDEASEMANADEAHKSLLNSLTTVNGAYTELLNKGVMTAPPALLMSVSSPMSQRDKVMRLLRESKTEEGKKTILGVNLPTWEVNPSMTRQTPVIASLYASNPEKAERDFGANPPLVHSRFILPPMIEKEVFINGQNSHELEYHLDSPGHIYGSLRKIRTFNQFPSVVALDAGSTNNSFAIAAGHFDFDRQKTVVTTLLECVPQEGRRVEFNKLYESAILPLSKELHAVSLNADQWNSIDLLHRARADMGLNPDGKDALVSTQYSLRRSDFENFRAMLENKSLILPSIKATDLQHIIDGNVHNYKREMLGKPVEHTALQMITIRDMGETKCPEKGEGFTDDILRALVLLVARIHHPKTMERLQQARPWVNRAKHAATGKPQFVSRSGLQFRPRMINR